MKKTILIIVVALILVAVVTCPDKDAHNTAVNNELREELRENVFDKDYDDDDDIWDKIGNTIGMGIVNIVTDSMLEVDNYFLFSVGHINLLGKDKVVSFGIFGHVFTYDD